MSCSKSAASIDAALSKIEAGIEAGAMDQIPHRVNRSSSAASIDSAPRTPLSDIRRKDFNMHRITSALWSSLNPGCFAFRTNASTSHAELGWRLQEVPQLNAYKHRKDGVSIYGEHLFTVGNQQIMRK